MNIPQVNVLATDRNREQTKRICDLVGADYHNSGGPQFIEARWFAPDKTYHYAQLPNGSFTLDQVVGMSEVEGARYRSSDYYNEHNAWFTVGKDLDSGVLLWGHALSEACAPHDITAAMDALIKVLEAKKNPSSQDASPRQE